MAYTKKVIAIQNKKKKIKEVEEEEKNKKFTYSEQVYTRGILSAQYKNTTTTT